MSEGSALAEYGLRSDQEEFVHAYVRTGSVATAAKECGRREPTVRKWMKQPKVSQAIQSEVRQRLESGAVAAVNTMREFMEHPDVDPKVRMNAAKDLLDRAGYKPDHLHTSADQRMQNASVNEMMGRIKELCGELGIANPTTIDVKPNNSEPPPPPKPDDADPMGEAPPAAIEPPAEQPAEAGPKPESADPAENENNAVSIINEIDPETDVEDDTDVYTLLGDMGDG